MKKLLLAILVFIFSVSSVGVGMAAVSRPPTVICLKWSSSPFTAVLSIKSFGGNVAISGGKKIKFYAIHGEATNGADFSAPVSGSGHMDGDIFHFSLTGSSLWIDGRQWSYHFEGSWNVVNNTGTGSYQGIVKDTDTERVLISDYLAAVTLQPRNCSATIIPYSTDSALEGTDFLPSEGP
jgi:hypothetical protein